MSDMPVVIHEGQMMFFSPRSYREVQCGTLSRSLIRVWRVALTPETGRPSLLHIDLRSALRSCLTFLCSWSDLCLRLLSMILIRCVFQV